MKKKGLVVFSIYLLIFILSFTRVDAYVPGGDPGDGGDTYGECGSSYSNYETMPYQGTEYCHLSPGGDEDYVSFTATYSGFIDIYSEGSVDIKADLIDYYGAGGGLVDTNDDGGSGSNFKFTIYAQKDHRYLLKIKGYSSSYSGDYKIKVRATDPTLINSSSDNTLYSSIYQDFNELGTHQGLKYVTEETEFSGVYKDIGYAFTVLKNSGGTFIRSFDIMYLEWDYEFVEHTRDYKVNINITKQNVYKIEVASNTGTAINNPKITDSSNDFDYYRLYGYDVPAVYNPKVSIEIGTQKTDTFVNSNTAWKMSEEHQSENYLNSSIVSAVEFIPFVSNVSSAVDLGLNLYNLNFNSKFECIDGCFTGKDDLFNSSGGEAQNVYNPIFDKVYVLDGSELIEPTKLEIHIISDDAALALVGDFVSLQGGIPDTPKLSACDPFKPEIEYSNDYINTNMTDAQRQAYKYYHYGFNPDIERTLYYRVSVKVNGQLVTWVRSVEYYNQ